MTLLMLLVAGIFENMLLKMGLVKTETVSFITAFSPICKLTG